MTAKQAAREETRVLGRIVCGAGGVDSKIRVYGGDPASRPRWKKAGWNWRHV